MAASKEIQPLLLRVPPKHLEVIQGFVNGDPVATSSISRAYTFLRKDLGLTEEELLSLIRYFSEMKQAVS